MSEGDDSTGGWDSIDDDQCGRAATVMEFVGRRWSSAILLALRGGATRFSAILATVTGLSDRMLALRLKELEHAGLLERLVEPTVPVSVRYRLTARGRDLLAALQPVAAYAHRYPTAPDEQKKPVKQSAPEPRGTTAGSAGRSVV